MERFVFFGIIAFVLFIAWGVWDDYIQPTFSLEKREWQCTLTHSHLVPQVIPTGNTSQILLVPQVECVQWTKV